MNTVIIDCSDIKSEAEFWRLYLETVKPDGAQFFGRNLSAFNDAVTAGGTGWPGEHAIRFVNTYPLQSIDDGKFYRILKKIAAECETTPIFVE